MTKRTRQAHRAPAQTIALKQRIIVVPLTRPGRNDAAHEIYAVVSRDDDGNEGITGMLSPDGWVPLVTCKLRDIDMLRPHLAEMAQADPKAKFVIRKFGQAVDIETIEA